jgi:heme exporter protein D
MKKLVFVILLLGLVFSLAMAKKMVNEVILTGDSLGFRLIHRESKTEETFLVKISPEYEPYITDGLLRAINKVVNNPSKEIAYCDHIRVKSIFPPIVEKRTWTIRNEDKEVLIDLSYLEETSRELILFFIFFIMIGFLVVRIYTSNKLNNHREMISLFFISWLITFLFLLSFSTFSFSSLMICLVWSLIFSAILGLLSSTAIYLGALISWFIACFPFLNMGDVSYGSHGFLVVIFFFLTLLSVSISWLMTKKGYKKLLKEKKEKEKEKKEEKKKEEE